MFVVRKNTEYCVTWYYLKLRYSAGIFFFLFATLTVYDRYDKKVQKYQPWKGKHNREFTLEVRCLNFKFAKCSNSVSIISWRSMYIKRLWDYSLYLILDITFHDSCLYPLLRIYCCVYPLLRWITGSLAEVCIQNKETWYNWYLWYMISLQLLSRRKSLQYEDFLNSLNFNVNKSMTYIQNV